MKYNCSMTKSLILFLQFFLIITTLFTSFANAKVTVHKPKIKLTPQQIENLELKNSYYYKAAKQGLSEFQEQSFVKGDNDLNDIFYKIEKRVVYQDIAAKEIQYFEFNHLTNAVVRYVQILKSNYDLTLDYKKRSLMQMNFYGLSQAIKKANEVNLTIQSEQFDKLHDMLVGHATSLFYASYKEVKYTDYFWTSYFLHELNYPMDLTAKHLLSLTERMKTFKYPERYRQYGERLARLSLGFAQKVTKPSTDDLEVLYNWALVKTDDAVSIQGVQKNYLKQLQLIGDTEKVKIIKKEIATNLLFQESKNFIHHPLEIFKFIQIIIGYIFVAWPLEMILFIVSISIFAFQSSSVLTREESRKAKTFHKRIWMMFTKAYLGSNVPFFSKLAASLILFGIGLYFNSAKNFVESMISTL
jgi:hypothetical protein